MKPDSLTSQTFKLQQYNRKTKKWKMIPATLSLSNGNTTATLDPLGTAGTLSAGKKYRGFITTGAKDLADNPLAQNFIRIFNTAK